jgi:hypothetical protein
VRRAERTLRAQMVRAPALVFDANRTLSRREPIPCSVCRDQVAARERPLPAGASASASTRAARVRCVAVVGAHPADRLRGADEIVEAIDVALPGRVVG